MERSRYQRRRRRTFVLMDRDQRIHVRGLQDLGNVVIGAQDDHSAALGVHDLGADHQDANGIRGEETHCRKVDDDPALFRDDLVEREFDRDCPGGIEASAQIDLRNAAYEVLDRDLHAACSTTGAGYFGIEAKRTSLPRDVSAVDTTVSKVSKRSKILYRD